MGEGLVPAPAKHTVPKAGVDGRQVGSRGCPGGSLAGSGGPESPGAPASHVEDEGHLGNPSEHSSSAGEAHTLEPERQDKGKAVHSVRVLGEG